MFKTKIKVLRHFNSGSNARQKRLEVFKKGDWIDLSVLGDHKLYVGLTGLLPLGISMALPRGFEAIVVPRSSTFKQFGLLQTNSVGIIDWSYRGSRDMWKFPFFAQKDVQLNHGDRICQFRIQLSQKATVWQKLKWLFSTGIQFQYVESLDEKSRGGFGTTGK